MISDFQLYHLIIFLHHFLTLKITVSTFITFLLILPSTLSQINQQDKACHDNLFSCGNTIQGIGFPFWGNIRPRNCGLEDFFLTCHNNTNTTISINGQFYRVLQIEESTRWMRLVLDQFSNNFCVPIYGNITYVNSLYSYRPNYENLTFFYNCPGRSIDISKRNTLTCPFEGVDTKGFFVQSRLLPTVANFSRYCDFNITLPVPTEGFEEFRDNESWELQDLLNFGFNLEYRSNNISSCSACNASGGLCRTNTTTTAQPTCLCRDGIYPLNRTYPTCPNPGIVLPNVSGNGVSHVSGKGKGLSLKLAIGIGAAALALIICICVLIFCCIRKSPTRSTETNRDRNVEDFIRQRGSHNPKRYSYSDIKKMTKSFKDELGRGGYGSVYKGKLPDGRLVAVKILNASKGNGEEFINEVASIGTTSHINVVSLFGFCYNGKRRALVYQYMSNGSLDKFLNNTDNHLAIEKLYEISLGVARGLEYLHRGCNTRILHFDIKPQNILLDDDFCPKIADFGLAKMFYGKESIVSMAETRGTIGYIAPEVFSRSFGNVSHKSDVYSYGMVLIEMVGGKSNDNAVRVAANSSEIYFPNWIYKRLEQNEVGPEGVMLFEESEIAKKMLIVGLWCILTDPVQRPAMNKVIDMLLGSLEDLQPPPKPILSPPPPPPPVLNSSTSGPSSYQ